MKKETNLAYSSVDYTQQNKRRNWRLYFKKEWKHFNFAAIIAIVCIIPIFSACNDPEPDTPAKLNPTQSYTVSFHANGGSGNVESITIKGGSTITLPNGAGFSKSGYTFDGWNTEADGKGDDYSAGDSFTVNGNVPLYAMWKDNGGGNGGGDNGGGGNGGGTASGLYMGIIGFNERPIPKNISLLSDNNSIINQFHTFIDTELSMKAATGLYYAVDNAIDMLEKATFPDDLANVAIVTFTDGLDNASIDLNPNYNTIDAYGRALNARIRTTKIKDLNISAYSIGIRGSDVTIKDDDLFLGTLSYLANDPDGKEGNKYLVNDMDEVNNIFKEIAADLSETRQSQSIKLTIPSGNDNGKIRFTFDDVEDAEDSEFYIEGNYRRSDRSLINIEYNNLYSSSGKTVTGSLDNVYVTFTFEDVKDDIGRNVELVYVKYYVESQGSWEERSEFKDQSPPPGNITDKKSLGIVLILDCTESLGTKGFSDMKKSANDFIDVLVHPTYKVTFNPNRGSNQVFETKVVDAGSPITLSVITSLSREGYTSAGWGTNPSGPPITDLQYTPTGNITFYAVWKGTVTFNASGGTGAVPDSMPFFAGSSTEELPDEGDLEKAGYDFRGWNTKSDLKGTSHSAGSSYRPPATGNGNITLYAIWEEMLP